MFKLRNHHAHIRLIWLMLLCTMVVSLLLSGCHSSKISKTYMALLHQIKEHLLPEPPFVSGTYATTRKQGDNDITEVKLILTEIDVETFQNANGCNVIKAYDTRNKPYYYSFELFLYMDAYGDCLQVNVVAFEQQKGAPHTYYGKVNASQCNFGVKNFTFVYDNFLLITQNGNSCYFYLDMENS